MHSFCAEPLKFHGLAKYKNFHYFCTLFFVFSSFFSIFAPSSRAERRLPGTNLVRLMEDTLPSDDEIEVKKLERRPRLVGQRLTQDSSLFLLWNRFFLYINKKQYLKFQIA